MTVRIDLSAMESRFGDAEAEKRQELFAMKAASLIRKYVPVEETTLRSSEPMNSDYRGGVLVWDTPYAATHFYVPMNHSEAGTGDHWDERLKGGDMGALEDFAGGLFGGGA